MKRTRRLEITVEKTECVLLGRPSRSSRCVWQIVTPEEANVIARLRLANAHPLEEGLLHFCLSPEGLLLVCINSH